MFFEDNLPKNKDINYLEKKETKHPLLQIIKKNKGKEDKKEDNKELPKQNPFLSQSHKNDSFSNIDLQKKNNNIVYKKRSHLTPKKEIMNLNNHRYTLSNEKLYSDIENSNSDNKAKDIAEYSSKRYSLRNKNITNINLISKNLFGNNPKTPTSHNNIIFPSLNLNNNLFRINKKIDKSIVHQNTDRNDRIYINNNSIFVSDPQAKKKAFPEKFKGNKLLLQKSVEFSLLINNSHKNSFRTINSKNSGKIINLNFNNFKESINIDRIDTFKKTEQNKYKKNNIISNFENVNNQLNKKFNKRKSVSYINKFNLFKNGIKTQIDKDKSKEIKLRNSINLKPQSLIKQPLTKENILLSPLIRKKINIKKISNKKTYKTMKEKKEISHKALNRISSPLKNQNHNKSNDENNDNDINMNNSEDSCKTINYISKKDIYNNPLNRFYNSIVDKKKYNLFNQNSSNKNLFTKEFIRTENENLHDSKKIKIINKKSFYDINSIFSKNYLNKDEEKYIKIKRLKLIEKVEKHNKESVIFNSYVEEIKQYFLKNCVIDKITENIFDNFEPLENRIENKNIYLEKREKYLKELLLKILNKSHKYCYSLEKILKLGESFLKEKKIIIKIRTINHYILEMFNVYPKLLKRFEYKWNNKRKKDYYYKKMVIHFSNNSDYFDKAFFIYKERINTDLNLNLNSINTRMNENKNKLNMSKKNSNKRKSSLKLKKLFNSKGILDKKTQVLSLFGQKTKGRHTTVKYNKKNSQYEDITKKMENFSKIQKQFGFTPRTESFEKFAKIYRIPKKSSKILNDLKIIEKEDKKYKTVNTEKEIIFNKAKSNLDNYNILKDRKLFHYSNNKPINLEKRFSQILNIKKNQIQLDKKLKIDSMTIKFAGMDQLTKEAALIKTQEIEKDLPDVKLFDKFVSAIQRRKISQFDYLIQKKEDKFNSIINKQEFSTGNSLLIYATLNNLKSLVELLLLKGANPNLQNKFGNSALHIAYKNDNAFIINLLFEYGADQKLKNSNGLFPWQMSKTINN